MDVSPDGAEDGGMRPPRGALLLLAGVAVGFGLAAFGDQLLLLPLIGSAGILLVLSAAYVGSHARPRRRRHWRGAALTGAEGWEELRRELDRSRRSDHAFTLVRIPAKVLDGAGESEPEWAVAAQLRSHDRVWTDQGSLYLLLPESGASVADAAVNRIAVAFGVEELHESVVSFPDDGVTSEALLARLHGYRVLGSFEVDHRGEAARNRPRRIRRAGSRSSGSGRERRAG
jgi:hypothetical protein